MTLQWLLLPYLILVCEGEHLFDNGCIFGGYDIAIEDAPWNVNLNITMLRGSFICSGAIIGPKTVITAAHCFENKDNPKELPEYISVRAGSKYSYQGGSVHEVTGYYIHPGRNDYDYDIAIVFIDKPLLLDATRQVISIVDQEPQQGTDVAVTGWSMGRDLRRFTTSVFNRFTCSNIFENQGLHISPRMFCLDNKKRHRPICFGDRGGPVVSREKLVGLYTWVTEDTISGFPLVSVNLANVEIHRWIHDITGI